MQYISGFSNLKSQIIKFIYQRFYILPGMAETKILVSSGSLAEEEVRKTSSAKVKEWSNKVKSIVILRLLSSSQNPRRESSLDCSSVSKISRKYLWAYLKCNFLDHKLKKQKERRKKTRASWSKTIQSVLVCGPRVLFLPTKQSARPIYSHDNATWKSSIP